MLAVGVADAVQLGDSFAGLGGIIETYSSFARRCNAFGLLLAQFFQGANPTLVTGAASLDTLADPGFFPRQFFVK